MSKILITIEDDPISGGVMYESKCENMTFHENEPSAAMLVAQTVLLYIKETYGGENATTND